MDFKLTAKGVELVPDGAFNISEASVDKLSVNLQTNDALFLQYIRNNAISRLGVMLNTTYIGLYRVIEGQIFIEDLIAKAYFRSIFPDVWWMASIQAIPSSLSEKPYIDRILGRIGTAIYPICLALLLPMFLYSIVLDKEERLLIMMKMNGLKIMHYWMSHFIFDLIIYAVSSSMFIAMGIILLDLDLFKHTSIYILFIVYLGWGYSQIALSFFYSAFLSKAQSSTILGYVMSIWVMVIAVSFNSTIFEAPEQMPLIFNLYPTFSFARLLYLLSIACGYSNCMTNFEGESLQCILMLYFSSTMYVLLGIYLNEVIPQQYGVARKPLFFLNYFRKTLFNCHSKKEKIFNDLDLNKTCTHIDLSGEDEDVKNEKDAVYNSDPKLYNLYIKDLRKVYKGEGSCIPKLALVKFNLAVKKGEMFGLLGPNGAGKTSLISMVTGIYEPTYGNAWINGYDIKENMNNVYKTIGICPQFDILWQDLTVKEHLELYAKLKYVKYEKEEVEQKIKEVNLEKFKDFKVCQLSGGMKRRLSVAISLIGNPSLMLLDEPTTGLDPENRRQLWDILLKCKNPTRSIILTTHSMEEADVLCTRIGIITNGVLRCVGTQQHLKNKYGSGYYLYIYCSKKEIVLSPSKEHHDSPQTYKKMTDFIMKILPNSKVIQSFNGYFIFSIPELTTNCGQIFEEVEAKKDEYDITDWGFSQCSLEDVFKSICINK